MANEFMETVKQFKEQATSKDGKGDPLYLPDSNPRKRSLNFTPQRGGRVAVAATQEHEDMESDSLSSHISRPRKRLLAPWTLILVKQ